MAAGISGTTY